MMVPDWVTINNMDGTALDGAGESTNFLDQVITVMIGTLAKIKTELSLMSG